MIDVLILAGTGFPNGGDGVCEAFAERLDRRRFAPRFVTYPATFGGLEDAWALSRAAGLQALIDATRATNRLVLPVGYSQGAGIAGDFAAAVGDGRLPGLELVGCALIADPARPAGATMPGRPAASGSGILRPRQITGMPAWWAAAEGDPITALANGSPLRGIADMADYYSLASPAAAIAWGRALLARAQARDWQPWWSLEYWRDWGGAVEDAWGYLPPPLGGGRHTYAYVTERLCADLAEAVNRGIQ
ncbi:hypothetical protein [Nocardia sp. CA-290969]|uniref:hypothetical protein n=1 Tax=Nocardia sp. CA-290969 TaxID=3239986 RepID=UPI003D910049